MAEYIEREAVVNLLRAEAERGATPYHIGLYAAARVVESIPAADVRPAKPGKWIPIECIVGTIRINFPGCSVCKHTVRDKTRFCPNCGAEMEGTE
jgi:hypothetical protein